MLIHLCTYQHILVCTCMNWYVLVCWIVLGIFYDAQASTIQSAGCVCLDINLLKPSRLEFQDQDLAPNLALHVGHRLCSSPDWLEYMYRTSHPVLRWLHTKLAEWIGENLQEALGYPDKGDVRAGPGSGWTAAELNHILQPHVVDGTLTTLGVWSGSLISCGA